MIVDEYISVNVSFAMDSLSEFCLFAETRRTTTKNHHNRVNCMYGHVISFLMLFFNKAAN